jgi:hypothetical protein
MVGDELPEHAANLVDAWQQDCLRHVSFIEPIIANTIIISQNLPNTFRLLQQNSSVNAAKIPEASQYSLKQFRVKTQMCAVNLTLSRVT